MVKWNHKSQTHCPKNATQSEGLNLSILRQDLELWYRLHVLLYHLNNVANDSSSEKRLSSTTNELYISEPYFTDSEAIMIRTAIVDGVLGSADEPIDAATNVTAEAEEEGTTGSSNSDSTSSTLNKETTVEKLIDTQLSNFLSKRKVSSDARPCGPHDMLPVSLSVFSVGKEEFKDDRFLSRLRKSGLGDCRAAEGNRGQDQSMKRGKGNKKRKKGN